MMIRAIVFDLGGTLLDFNPHHRPWLEWERTGLENALAFLSSRGYALSPEAFVGTFAGALPERWEQATQGLGNLRLGDMLLEACLASDAAPTAEEIEAAVAHYIAPLDERVVAYDDTLDTLRALRERGLKVGLVSNTMWPSEYHLRELDRYGLRPYLHHVVFSSDVGLWKPQPGIYRLSLDALGIPAEEAAFVGDMPEHDIVGAQGVGMRAIYKRNDEFVPDGVRPDAVIQHLSELLPLIDRWQVGG